MNYKAVDKAGYTEIITSDDCIKHLYLDEGMVTNSLLSVYIKAARKWVEQYCNIALVTKTVTIYTDLPAGTYAPIDLPLTTEEEDIEDISYTPSTGCCEAPINVALANIPTPNFITPYAPWPSGKATITYTATPHQNDDAIKAAVVMLVAHLYEHRDIVSMPDRQLSSIKFLLSPFRQNTQP